MPAHKKRNRLAARRRGKTVKRNSRMGVVRLFIVFLILIIFGFSYFAFQANLWDENNRLSLAIATEPGDVVLAVFDPLSDNITTLTLPADTEVNVARQLGTWRLGSVWELGENEKIGGALIAETVTKSFKLPTEAWAQSPALGFVETDVRDIFKATFSTYKTNLTFKDKLSLGLFALRVKNTNRLRVDAVTTRYLTRIKLADGTLGYRVKEEALSPGVLSVFADSIISKQGVTVSIIDNTGRTGVANEVGEIVEVMGGKVVSIRKAKASNIDCQLIAKDLKVAKKIAITLGCSLKSSQEIGNFDMEISIGEKFGARF